MLVIGSATDNRPISMQADKFTSQTLQIGDGDMGSIDLALRSGIPSGQLDNYNGELRAFQHYKTISSSSSSNSSPNHDEFNNLFNPKKQKMGELASKESRSASQLPSSNAYGQFSTQGTSSGDSGTSTNGFDGSQFLATNFETYNGDIAFGSTFAGSNSNNIMLPGLADPWSQYTASAAAIASATDDQIQQSIQDAMAGFQGSLGSGKPSDTSGQITGNLNPFDMFDKTWWHPANGDAVLPVRPEAGGAIGQTTVGTFGTEEEKLIGDFDNYINSLQGSNAGPAPSS